MIQSLRWFLASSCLALLCNCSVLAQQPSKKISGTVVDQQGQPIAGARLSYPYAYDVGANESISAEAVSDAKGHFALDVPTVTDGKEVRRALSPQLWASAEGYCLGFADREYAGKERQMIELAPATDTSFVIVAPNGKPLEDVLVEPQNYRTWMGYDMVPRFALPLLSRRTDSDGRVRLPSLARDRLYLLRLTSKDFGVQTKRPGMKPDAPAERTIQLRPVGSIQGRVVADHLAWCGGIKLHFSTEKPFAPGEKMRPPWPTEGTATAVTDKTGRFAVPVIAAGRVTIDYATFANDVHARPLFPSANVLQGQSTTLEIPMQRMVQIRGSIIAADTREPIKEIKIHVYYGSSRQGTDVVSDSRGEFSAWVLPGKVRFQPIDLSKTNYVQLGQPKQHDVPEDAKDLKLPPIEAAATKPIRGRLVDQDDKPVADASVMAFYNNWLCSSGTSDANGEFTFPKMPTAIDFNEAMYHVRLDEHETRNMRDGGVRIEPVETLKIRVQR